MIRRRSRARRITPSSTRSARSIRWIGQGRLLYLFLIPLFVSIVLSLVGGHYGLFLKKLIGFGLVLSAALFTQRGSAQEATYREHILAKAPRIPYKTLAMVLIGIAVFYLAWIAGDRSMLASIFVGGLTSVGYLLYYGLDPRKDKLPDMGDINPELVLQTLNEARDKLAAAQRANDRITDRTLHRKIDQAIAQAHQILETIQHDPKDLRVARKFLVVFVDGIADVTHRYTDVDADEIDETMRQRLHDLIDDVQQRFDQELARLRANNLFDLDVSIDTLKAQINH